MYEHNFVLYLEGKWRRTEIEKAKMRVNEETEHYCCAELVSKVKEEKTRVPWPWDGLCKRIQRLKRSV